MTAVSFSVSSRVAALTAVRAAGTGETFKNITAGAGSIAAALAVIVGGFWAYSKFLRGRTYKPRLSVEMAGQWRVLLGVGNVFHARIRVTNIGASKVTLKQYGTGLRISFPAQDQPAPPWDVRWEPVRLRGAEQHVRVFKIFTEHEWIEPGETVSDDLLLNIGRSPGVAMLELRLTWSLSPKRLWRWSRRVHRWMRSRRAYRRSVWGRTYRWILSRRICRWILSRRICRSPNDYTTYKDVVVSARQIIPADTTMIDN